MKTVLLCLCCIASTLVIPKASATTNLRVVAWNIADFHHKAGVEARPDIGTRRYKADFKALRKYADALEADVVALQEIVTPEAARQLFPASQYNLFMSTRYHDDLANGLSPDIYTAIVTRIRSDIVVIKQEDLAGLQLNPDSTEVSNPDSRSKPTRRGTAVLLDIKGKPLWIVSVHLKSSCPKTRKLDRSRQKSCQMLWKQRVPLKNWIDARIDEKQSFVIAGDYNRRFGQLKDTGMLWSSLNDNDLVHPKLVKYPHSGLRKCSTRKGKSMHPIDWFVVDAALAQHVVKDSYRETRWTHKDSQRYKRRLSDHCPIQIDLTL